MGLLVQGAHFPQMFDKIRHDALKVIGRALHHPIFAQAIRSQAQLLDRHLVAENILQDLEVVGAVFAIANQATADQDAVGAVGEAPADLLRRDLAGTFEVHAGDGVGNIGE